MVEMKAMVIDEFGGPEKIHLTYVDIVPPADDEVQIEISYAAVNPVDWKIREGYLKDRMPFEFPIVLGWDAAGKISAIGKNVKNLNVGDSVYAYCRKPSIQWGTYAEFINLSASSVAIKPKKINFAEAAAFPLVALTAWQSLFDRAQLVKDEKVLIHAGAGGVGSVAIQLAKSRGAYVITTASESNFDYVKSLGADEIIDYKKASFVDEIQKNHPEGVDVVFDTVGGKVFSDSIPALKSNGRIVSILEGEFGNVPQGIKAFYVFVEPNGNQLLELADLIEQGKVVAPKIIEMELIQAGEAQERLRNKDLGGGKIVLKIE